MNVRCIPMLCGGSGIFPPSLKILMPHCITSHSRTSFISTFLLLFPPSFLALAGYFAHKLDYINESMQTYVQSYYSYIDCSIWNNARFSIGSSILWLTLLELFAKHLHPPWLHIIIIVCVCILARVSMLFMVHLVIILSQGHQMSIPRRMWLKLFRISIQMCQN